MTPSCNPTIDCRIFLALLCVGSPSWSNLAWRLTTAALRFCQYISEIQWRRTESSRRFVQRQSYKPFSCVVLWRSYITNGKWFSFRNVVFFNVGYLEKAQRVNGTQLCKHIFGSICMEPRRRRRRLWTSLTEAVRSSSMLLKANTGIKHSVVCECKVKLLLFMPLRHIGSWGVALLILNLVTRWRWSFTFQPLHSRWKKHGTDWVGSWWAREPLWTLWRTECLAFTGNRTTFSTPSSP